MILLIRKNLRTRKKFRLIFTGRTTLLVLIFFIIW